jgi:ribosomal protein L11 methyltransferase
MRETYLSIRCIIPEELEEELPELLAPWGVLGTEIGDRTDGGVVITVYLPEIDFDGAASLSRLLVDQGACEVDRKVVEAVNWLAGFRESTRPFEVGGRWWIDPHPDRPTAAPDGRRRLVIEPRMAFGTGSHESTQAILVALEDIDVRGRRVLDVGTGSGILALAAETMGAVSVVGLDIDETAIWVALETARRQEWSSLVRYVLGSVECIAGAEFDIVMCNMITSSFLPLARDLRDMLAQGGVAVFSGLLASEVESVSWALTEAGFVIPSRRILGDWARLTAVGATVP